jgi:hypothetical protein
VFVTLVRMLHLIQIAWMVLMIGGMVHLLMTDRMIVMSQTINGTLSRCKRDRYRWRHEGEHSKGGHSKCYAEADAAPQCCQHGAELAISCTDGILLAARLRATARGTHVLYQ